MADIKPAEVSAILREQLSGFRSEAELQEVGTVLQVGDGIARIYGMNGVQYGELIEFAGGMQGIALNLEEDNVGAVLLGRSSSVKEGDTVRRLGKIASVKVGDGVVGRVIDTLGQPIDGKGPIAGELFEMPIERKAPGVIFRQPVTEPLQTGIKAIDAMIPIGRGQRELIIGDRQTGKTTVAIDTIINQREFYDRGEPVYCIYVAIGQKGSTVAGIYKKLEDAGAMADQLDALFEAHKASLKAQAPSQKFKAIDPSFGYEDIDGKPCFTISVKMKAKGMDRDGRSWSAVPALFDASGAPVKDREALRGMWSGTEGRVSFEACPFYQPALGAGITLRLKAVQILKLVESGGSADSFGFQEEAGGWAASETQAAIPFDATGTATDEGFDF